MEVHKVVEVHTRQTVEREPVPILSTVVPRVLSVFAFFQIVRRFYRGHLENISTGFYRNMGDAGKVFYPATLPAWGRREGISQKNGAERVRVAFGVGGPRRYRRTPLGKRSFWPVAVRLPFAGRRNPRSPSPCRSPSLLCRGAAWFPSSRCVRPMLPLAGHVSAQAVLVPLAGRTATQHRVRTVQAPVHELAGVHPCNDTGHCSFCATPCS